MANIRFCLLALVIGIFGHEAGAQYAFIELEVDEGSYHAGDPVEMTLTVINTSSSTICNPLMVDVHLTPDGRFRSETDHLLNRLGGPILSPGETWTFRWVQMMPGNLTGTFFLDAEAYTTSGPETDCGGDLASAFIVETAKITLLHSEHPETELVSVSETNAQGLGNSETPSISRDGRWIAFASEASSLLGVQRDENGEVVLDDEENPIGLINNGLSDIFLRDQWTGEVERITTPIANGESNGASYRPRLSRDADARWVVFHSQASNLTTDPLTNSAFDVFRHDRATGTTVLVSRAHGGGQALRPSQNASISADGRWVAFESEAENLLAPGQDTNGLTDIFVRDMDTGSLRRVNVADGTLEVQALGGQSRLPRISADGRHVIFESRATNLVSGGKEGLWEVYVHDRDVSGSGTFDQAGNVATIRMSVAYDEEGNPVFSDGHSTQADLSADGRFVTFTSEATNLYSEPAQGSIVLDGRSAEGTVQFQENTPGIGKLGFHPDAFATGTIAFPNNPADAETLEISDGGILHRFEFDGPVANGYIDGNIPVYVGATPTATRNELLASINEAFLINEEQSIQAVPEVINGHPGIRLTNIAYGSPEADQPINDLNAPSLVVTGMNGANVTNPSPGDTLEIDTGRAPPVTFTFFSAGNADPTDYDGRIVGVEIGRTAKETSLNLLAAFEALGYTEYDVPALPDYLLPPLLENPEEGNAFTLTYGDEEDEDNYFEETFFFRNAGPQYDPTDPTSVLIGQTPQITRGNLIRAIMAAGFTFEPLPAVNEATGQQIAFGESFVDAPATGAIALRVLPEDGHTITISDGFVPLLFRFADERDQTELEEEAGIPVPPYEMVGGTMVIYIVEENRPATENRLLNAIRASRLNLTARFGFSVELDRGAIILLNNLVGDFANVEITHTPELTQEEIDNGDLPWVLLHGMEGGVNAQPTDGQQIVFYPENLLHPRVVFEFRFDLEDVSSDAYGVQIGATGYETEGNFFGALFASGLPWLTAEEPLIDEEPVPSDPTVRLESFVHTGDGAITFTLKPSNPGAFASLDVEDGTVMTPRHGGTITIFDGATSETFQFTFDGSVQEEEYLPIQIGPTAAHTRDNLIRAISEVEHLEVLAVDTSGEDDVEARVFRIEGGPVDDFITGQDIAPFASLVDLHDGQWNPAAGERFEIRDGFSDPVIFEFVSAAGDAPGTAEIVLGDPAGEAGGRAETRDNLIEAIKNAGLKLEALATTEDNSPAVHLTHLVPGAIGNYPIEIVTENSRLRDNPSFAVRGMAGGGNLGTGVPQIYLIDRDADENGVYDETRQVAVELISKTPLDTAGNDISLEPTVTDDGRYVAFRTQANDLLPLTVARSDSEGFKKEFKNLPGTAFIDPTLRATDLTQMIANLTDVDEFSDIYLYDRDEGVHRRVDVNRFGESLVGGTIRINFPRSSRSPVMSTDGRFIAFESDDESYRNPDGRLHGDGLIRGGGMAHGRTNRHTIDHNDYRDVFVHDRRFISDGSPNPDFPGGAVVSVPGIIEGGMVTVGSPVDLEAVATGLLPGRTVSAMRFFANGLFIGEATIPAIPGGDVFAIRWVPNAAIDYQIVAVAVDNRGRTLPTSDVVNLTAKNAANQVQPVAAIFNPLIEEELIPGNAFPLTDRSEWPFVAFASSGQHDIVEVEFSIRNLTPLEIADDFIDESLGGVSMGVAQPEPHAEDPGVRDNVWRLNFDFAGSTVAPSGLPPGYYVVRATVRDSFGNLGSSAPLPIIVAPAPFDRPTAHLSVNRRQLNRDEYTRFSVQADTAQGQIERGGEVYMFVNGSLINYDGHENPKTARPFVWDAIAKYTGTFNVFAVVRDAEGNTGVSNVVQITIHDSPNGGDPSDPAQNEAFIAQTFNDLLWFSPSGSPGFAVIRNYLSALEAGTKTRGQVVAEVMKHPDFDTVRWVIAAYLTVMNEPPRYDQLVDGILLLTGGGDEDGGDEDEDGGNVSDGVPPFLPLLISDILNSNEFWMKYGTSGEYNLEDDEDLLEIIHDGNVSDARLNGIRRDGRQVYLSNETARRLAQAEMSRDVMRTALILMLLQRDTTLAEARRLSTDTSAAAQFVVTSSAYVGFHTGSDSFLLITNSASLVGTWDPASGMYVRESEWFGSFSDGYFNYSMNAGWLKHTEHGWLYVAPNSMTPNGVWFWDHIQQDWLWTAAGTYPRLFSDDDNRWLFYLEGGKPSLREFRAHDGAVWGDVFQVKP